MDLMGLAGTQSDETIRVRKHRKNTALGGREKREVGVGKTGITTTDQIIGDREKESGGNTTSQYFKMIVGEIRRRNINMRIVACFAIVLCHGIGAFQLSMVASRAPLSRSIDGTSSRSAQSSLSQSVQSRTPRDSVTSSLVSNLAVVALKMRLKGQRHVGCDVTASSSDVLLKGQVGPVTVKGRGWESNLGLTCRAIEATVDRCHLDVSRIVSNQKLVLTIPAEGSAMVALNAVDFGNFITHPLMKPPGLPEIHSGDDSTGSLQFSKEGVEICAENGAVIFYGDYMDQRWCFELRRGADGNRASILVREAEATRNDLDYASIAAALTEVTSNFFNEMVFELDGTFLSFRDMMVTGKGKEPSVMLSLSILVRKFPSPGLAF